MIGRQLLNGLIFLVLYNFISVVFIFCGLFLKCLCSVCMCGVIFFMCVIDLQFVVDSGKNMVLISIVSSMIVQFQLLIQLWIFLSSQNSGFVMIVIQLQFFMSFRFGVMFLSMCFFFGLVNRCVCMLVDWFGVIVVIGCFMLMWYSVGLIFLVQMLCFVFCCGIYVDVKQCCIIVIQLLFVDFLKFVLFLLRLLKLIFWKCFVFVQIVGLRNVCENIGVLMVVLL